MIPTQVTESFRSGVGFDPQIPFKQLLTVWPQYTNRANVTDRTDRQDNGPIANGRPKIIQETHKKMQYI